MMVVVYEPDARNAQRMFPVEVACAVCGNMVLYRLGVSESCRGGVYHRRCPVCRQESTYKVPDEVADAADRYLRDTVPREMRDAAEKWFNKRAAEAARMRRKRTENPAYGQVKKRT
jgi:hypothetical protein